MLHLVCALFLASPGWSQSGNADALLAPSRQQIGAAKLFRVSFHNEAFFSSRRFAVPSGGSLLQDAGGRFVYETDIQRTYWDGKLATTYHLLDDRVLRSKEPPTPWVAGILNVLKETKSPERVERSVLTNETQGSQQILVRGVCDRSVWVDVAYWSEIWFDSKSQLISRWIQGSGGMTTRYRIETQLTWDLNPEVSPNEFKPRPYSRQERESVSSDRYIFRVANGITSGMGKLTVEAPPGSSSTYLDIEHPDEVTQHMALLKRPCQVEAWDGFVVLRHPHFITRIPIHRGYETVFRLGAVKNGSRATVKVLSPAIELKPGQTSMALLPRTYEATVARRRTTVVVARGKITVVK